MYIMTFDDLCALIGVLHDVLPGSAINIALDIGTLDSALTGTLTGAVIACEFAMPIENSVDVLVDVAIGALTDADIILGGTWEAFVSASYWDLETHWLTDITFDCSSTDIGADMLPDENANGSAVTTPLERK